MTRVFSRTFMLPVALTVCCLGAVLIAPLTPSAASARQAAVPPQQLEPVDQFWGAIRAVDVVTDTAFVGHGTRLLSLDVANPDQVVPVGQGRHLGGVVQDVTYRDGAVYATASYAGLYVLDVGDRSNPVVIGHHPVSAGFFSQHLKVSGDLALVHDEDLFAEKHKLWLVPIGDVDGLSGVTPSSVTESSLINDAAVIGDVLYVGVGDLINGNPAYLKAYDISQPASPRSLWTRQMPADPRLLAAHGDRLVAATTYYETGSHLVVYDVSDDGSLSEAGRLEIDVGFVSEIGIEDDRIVLFADYDMLVFGLPPDGTPVPVGGRFEDRRLSNAWFTQLSVVNDRLYLATGGDSGLVILDASAPDQVRIVGGYATVSLVEDIATTDSLVLVSGIVVKQVHSANRYGRDPLADPHALPSIVAEDIAAHENGERLFTVGAEGIRAYDIDDPQLPRPVGQANLGSSGHHLNLVGDLALVGRVEVDVDVFYTVADLYDVSDPGVMTKLAALGQAAIPMHGGLVVDDYLHVLRDNGVDVYDISDPAAAAAVAHVEVPWLRSGVLQAHRSHVYVAADGFLHVIDAAHPRQPELVRSMTLPRAWYEANDIGILNDRLVVLMNRHIGVYDLSDPALPLLVAEGLPGWKAYGMAIEGDLVYVADTVAGVTVWRVPQDLPPKPTSTLHLPIVMQKEARPRPSQPPTTTFNRALDIRLTQAYDLGTMDRSSCLNRERLRLRTGDKASSAMLPASHGTAKGPIRSQGRSYHVQAEPPTRC